MAPPTEIRQTTVGQTSLRGEGDTQIAVKPTVWTHGPTRDDIMTFMGRHTQQISAVSVGSCVHAFILCEVNCVLRWSSGNCRGTVKFGAARRRTGQQHHDALTLTDVSALFIAVAVVIVGVVTTLTVLIVRYRQPRRSNDQASSACRRNSSLRPFHGAIGRASYITIYLCYFCFR